MDHNSLDVISDFIVPLSEFLANFKISTDNQGIKKKDKKSPIRHIISPRIGSPTEFGNFSHQAPISLAKLL